MTEAISSIQNYTGISFGPILKSGSNQSLHNFDIEDKAIISSQAKILNELDKYNAGESDEINLALTTATSKQEIEAVLKVIDTKNDILEKIVKIGE